MDRKKHLRKNRIDLDDIYSYMSYDEYRIEAAKWKNFCKLLKKDCNIYFSYIEPRLSNFELLLILQNSLLICDAKIFNNRINITINNYMPDDITKGFIAVIDNVLLFVDTDETIIIKDQESNINKCLNKLNNPKFVSNVSEEVINLENKKLQDAINLQNFNLLNICFTKYKKDFIYIFLYFEELEKIFWHIEYYRELNTKIEKYSKEWFDYIYQKNITEDEIKHLMFLKSGSKPDNKLKKIVKKIKTIFCNNYSIMHFGF